MTHEQTQAERARQAIRRLLDGRAPNGPSDQDFGRWAEIVASLSEAHSNGGTKAVRRVFDSLAKDDLALAVLVAGDQEPPQSRWTLDELYRTEFPEPVWAVPDLLPVGLSFLAGRPKLGKSWLALQVAHAVATGGRTLGQEVEQGRVFVLALEDNPRRLKDRCKKQGIPAGAQITFETMWRPLPKGGLADLQAEIERERYRLVVIDTFSRAAGDVDQADVSDMTAILSNLQRVALMYDVAVLLIDHHRKSMGFLQSPVDDILGSTAKAAVADCALGLFREQGKHGATLKVTGRDIEERDLALEWDAITWCWQSLGAADEVRKDTVQGEILAAIGQLADMGEAPCTSSIASHLGKDKGQVSRALAELLAMGKVVKLEKDGRTQPYGLA